MATKVYDTFELELENGESVTIKPLPIKHLRKFMDLINEDTSETENDMIDLFINACVLSLKALHPKIFGDKTKEDIEELVTLPTVMKILEVTGGLKPSDPNLLGAALVGTN